MNTLSSGSTATATPVAGSHPMAARCTDQTSLAELGKALGRALGQAIKNAPAEHRNWLLSVLDDLSWGPVAQDQIEQGNLTTGPLVPSETALRAAFLGGSR